MANQGQHTLRLRQFCRHIRDHPIEYTVLAISIVGLGYTIAGLYAAYRACELARDANDLARQALVLASDANRWAYYTYELALFSDRLALISLCAQNVTINQIVCDEVLHWDYLPSLLNDLRPKTPTPTPPSFDAPPYLPQPKAFASTTAGKVVIGYGIMGCTVIIAASSVQITINGNPDTVAHLRSSMKFVTPWKLSSKASWVDRRAVILNERVVAKVITAFSDPDTETGRTRIEWPRTPSGGVSGPEFLYWSCSNGNHKIQPRQTTAISSLQGYYRHLELVYAT
ncbi:hypothetical protein DL98DRAFT_536826 [Cadophora sp. DSE1049]|nr:hypothetical protein DL98DRAFT_536826 [Cadophora sp. DSE1049]